MARVRESLPIDRHLTALVEALGRAGSLVVVAEPGAGKTTRVPPALLDAGLSPKGEIWVLQPRRIAVRMSARRVAEERGQRPGDEIGYQVRFEERIGPRTRVRFVTEGILTRRLMTDPELTGVGLVVLDEFHERSWHADLALCRLRHLQRGARPDLRVLVMSATLDADPVAAFLGCEAMHVAGRPHPVDVDYAPSTPEVPLARAVASALRGLIADGLDGDVLVFLPGAGEIRRAEEACAGICKAAGVELAILHGDLTAEQQDRAVRPAGQRKVILSTNIAETSLTIEGVVAVIDSGLARVPAHSPFTGLPSLRTEPISQASAEQRAGRAGRVRRGRCVRLYSRHDFTARRSHDTPELQRADLSELVMSLAAIGFAPTMEDWLQPPPSGALAQAQALLVGLSALSESGGRVSLTPLGQRLLRLPVHPRLGRLLWEAAERGVAADGAAVAAMLGERDILRDGRARFDDGPRHASSGPSDLLARLDVLAEVERAGIGQARALGADAGALRSVLRVRDRLLAGLPRDLQQRPSPDDPEQALGLAVLAGFFDRVAKRRRPGSDEVVFARGGSATVAPQSVVRTAEFVVVVDAAEREGRGRGVWARMLSAIEPEWLIELFPERVVDHTRTVFDPVSERVDAFTGLSYDGLVLEESRSDGSSSEIERALARVAAEHGYAKLFDLDAADAFLRRWAFAAERGALPAPPQAPLEAAVALACAGHRSLADLRRQDLSQCLLGVLGHAHLATLERVAPESVRLASGRRLRVHYEPDRPPWVASRLQDFFGLSQGPTLAGQPLVLHLLAPNQRAVQVTQDLAGFWARHYPEQRRALMRRYPKHAWPEDPLTARPPEPRGRRA